MMHVFIYSYIHLCRCLPQLFVGFLNDLHEFPAVAGSSRKGEGWSCGELSFSLLLVHCHVVKATTLWWATGCVSWGFARCSNFHQVPIWALVALLWFWLWNWLRHMDAWGIWTAFGFSCSNDLAFWCALSNIRHYIEMYSCLACVIFHCKKLKEEIHIWYWDIFRFSGCGFFSCSFASLGFKWFLECSSMCMYAALWRV